jgi:hypothetical protein
VSTGVFALDTVLPFWEQLPRLEATEWLGHHNLAWSACTSRRFAVPRAK